MGATAARNNWWLLVELNVSGVRRVFDPLSWGIAAEQPCADQSREWHAAAPPAGVA